MTLLHVAILTVSLGKINFFFTDRFIITSVGILIAEATFREWYRNIRLGGENKILFLWLGGTLFATSVPIIMSHLSEG